MPRISSIASLNSSKSPGKQYVSVNRNLATSPGQVYEWNQHTGWGARTDVTIGGATSQVYQTQTAHPSGSFIIVGFAVNGGTSGRLHAFSINRSGIVSDASGTLTASGVFSVGVTPNGRAVVAGFDTALSPYVQAYPFTTTFGTKYADPATALASFPRSISFTNSGLTVIIANISAPNIHAYAWTDATGFGTKYANPTAFTGSPLAAQSMDVITFPDGTQVAAIGTNTTPYLNAYVISDSGVGTKYTAPTALFSGIVNRPVKFIYNGTTAYLIVGPGTTPYLAAIDFSASTGFGTKLADPATAFGGIPYGLATADANQTIFVKTSGNAPVAAAYRFTNAWGTKYADPTVAFSTSTTDASICFIETP